MIMVVFIPCPNILHIWQSLTDTVSTIEAFPTIQVLMDGPSLVYPTDPYLTDYSRPSPVVEAALRDNHLRLNNSPNLCRTERDLQAAENPYQNFAHRCLQ